MASSIGVAHRPASGAGLQRGSGLHLPADRLHGRGLDLADALGRDAVDLGELLQGGPVFGEPALLENVAAALVELGQGPVQALSAVCLPVLGLQQQGGVAGGIAQKVFRGGAALALGGTAVKGQVAGAEPPLMRRNLWKSPPRSSATALAALRLHQE